MHRIRLTAPFLAGALHLAAFLAPAAARPNVSFTEGIASGLTFGQGTRRSDNEPLPEVQIFAGPFHFAGASGEGGTSGGLVDGIVQVASVQVSLSANITNVDQDTAQITLDATGSGTFFLPAQYEGSLSASVSFDEALVFDLSDDGKGQPFLEISGTGLFASADSIRRVSDNVEFCSGSFIPPGRYYLIQSGSVSVGVSDSNVSATTGGTLTATLTGTQCEPPEQPPVFQTHPQGANVCVGSTAQLGASAVGPPPLSYRWRRNGGLLSNGISNTGSLISGADTPVLTITDFNPADSASYDCVATNACGSIDSLDAFLNAASGPVLTSQPQSQLVCPRGTAVFSLGANGLQPFTFQWRRGTTPLMDGTTINGSRIQGARTSVLRVIGVCVGDTGSAPSQLYNCVVTNACGEVITGNAQLRMCPADLVCNGTIDSQDFFAFLGAFFSLSNLADCNCDRAVTSEDFFFFLSYFFDGCP